MRRIVPLLVLLAAVLYVAIYGSLVKPKDALSIEGPISRVETLYTSYWWNPNAPAFVPRQPYQLNPPIRQVGPPQPQHQGNPPPEFITQVQYGLAGVPMQDRFLLTLTWPATFITTRRPDLDLTSFRMWKIDPNRVLPVAWIDDATRATPPPHWQSERHFDPPFFEELKESLVNNPDYPFPFLSIWPPRHFTVHGLWQDGPLWYQGGASRDVYDMTRMDTLFGMANWEKMRNEAWPDCKTSHPRAGETGLLWASIKRHPGIKPRKPRWTTTGFWRQEYLKHGVPMTADRRVRHATHVRGSVDYFRLVMRLWDRHHFVALLRSRNPAHDNNPIAAMPNNMRSVSQWDNSGRQKGWYGMFRGGNGTGYDEVYQGGQSVHYGFLGSEVQSGRSGYAGSRGTLRQIQEAILHHLRQVTGGSIEDDVLAKSFITTCVLWNSDNGKTAANGGNLNAIRASLPPHTQQRYADYVAALNESAVWALFEVRFCFDTVSQPEPRLTRCRVPAVLEMSEMACPTTMYIYIP